MEVNIGGDKHQESGRSRTGLFINNDIVTLQTFPKSFDFRDSFFKGFLERESCEIILPVPSAANTLL